MVKYEIEKCDPDSERTLKFTLIEANGEVWVRATDGINANNLVGFSPETGKCKLAFGVILHGVSVNEAGQIKIEE